MKYKLLGLAACAAAIFLSVLAPLLFSGHKKVARVHQHRQAVPEHPCTETDDGGLCTYLPIVEIDTAGAAIPGRPILQTATELLYTTAADGGTTIGAELKVIGTDPSVYHHANDPGDLTSPIRIRIRGNSSRYFDKPSYAIRLVDENGANAPATIMGMDAHHEWVLYGPWLDKTAIRNYMFYNLAGEMMDYAPNVRFCEVLLNGEYQGLYVMTERITGGKNGARLALTVSAKRRSYTGYLLRLDHQDPNAEPLNTFTAYTHTTPLMLQLEYPGRQNLDAAQIHAIQQDFSAFESALYSSASDSSSQDYRRQIDVDSFVDYFILNELSSNADAGNYSTYIYKGIDGRFHMCVWDFNNACNNYFEEEIPAEGFFMQNRLWFCMLMKDKDFTARIIYRYRQLRKGILSEQALDDYMDETLVFIAPALKRNDVRWGDAATQANLLRPAARNLNSRSAAERQLKGYLHYRGDWLDAHIDTLRQYSAPSRVNAYNGVNR